jgi:hypothetical protein
MIARAGWLSHPSTVVVATRHELILQLAVLWSADIPLVWSKQEHPGSARGAQSKRQPNLHKANHNNGVARFDVGDFLQETQRVRLQPAALNPMHMLSRKVL